MHLDQLRQCLDAPENCAGTPAELELTRPRTGWRNLVHLSHSIGFDNLLHLCHPLARLLPRCPDPDMALNNLERFLAHPIGGRQLTHLLESRGRTLETLLQLFGTSQFFSDLLGNHPNYLDMARMPLRRSPSSKELQEVLQQQIDAAFEDSRLLSAFREFRQRQVLRIGTNDIIRDRPLEEITRDISRVADAALEVALADSLRHVANRFGEPFTAAGQPARCVILAFGKHGGEELNYSSDIDLMFLYDEEGNTRGKRASSIGNNEFFARVVSEVVRLLICHTDAARPIASICGCGRKDSAVRWPGRWPAPCLITIRSAAPGSGRRSSSFGRWPATSALGEQFLKAIEPFVYRKYLSFAEINEIKALKRRIEHKTSQAGETRTEVKTGHGGIRDIEFTIQFLQLLNGGDLPALRQRNTLLAMHALEEAGCLTDQEYRVLDDAYRFLRKTEHRLQLLFDLQTHRLPDGAEELHKLALRMGYQNAPPSEQAPATPKASLATSALAAFLPDYQEKTELDRKILDHLLHQTFQGEDGRAEPESDLILDPNPDPETIRAVLGQYPFRDVTGAYQEPHPAGTGDSSVPVHAAVPAFSRQHRARLLRALAETPDPDMALVNLEKVTASLGAKSVLWELFSFNQPSLKLYVDLCAWSQFLSEILINNPGMIDELLDSLVLNQPRVAGELRQELAELCQGAADLEPILHSFQDKELLRIGVRDILGKDTIQATTAALSDLAETMLVQIAGLQERAARQALRRALSGGRAPSRAAEPLGLLGLGKLGGREMSYHSDLDLVVIYEGDGRTGPPPGASRFDRFELTDNFHFFTELAQRIIKVTSFLGPQGRLYQVDMRLRPTGKSGSLVLPLTEFRKYYEEGGAQLWERQALCRGRVLFGDSAFAQEVLAAVEEGVCGLPWALAFRTAFGTCVNVSKIAGARAT